MPKKFPSLLLFHAAIVLPATLEIADAGSAESNLCLVDTENPDISALAEVLGGSEKASNFDQFNERNKIGVFHSSGLRSEHYVPPILGDILSRERHSFLLLDPMEGRASWSLADLASDGAGSLFMMNGGVYDPNEGANHAGYFQPFTDKMASLSWDDEDLDGGILDLGNAGIRYFWEEWPGDTPGDDLSLFADALVRTAGNADRTVSFHKRFEFPRDHAELDRLFSNYENEWEKDYKTIDPNSTKLVIVLHGWDRKNSSDPYAKDQFAILLENLHSQIRGQLSDPNTLEPISPDKHKMDQWDLYAYNWAADAITGGALLLPEDPHAVGGVGTAIENGTQAAEIGYQHGLQLGKLLRDRFKDRQLEKVHFIAHSAGTWVARSASLYLSATQPEESELQQQITLLDPYNPGAGYDQWDGFGGEPCPLGTDEIDRWPDNVDAFRFENAYSEDNRIKGTNERYWGGSDLAVHIGTGAPLTNQFVGRTEFGEAGDGSLDGSAWNGHGGVINYYAYSVAPSDKRTTGSWVAGLISPIPGHRAMALVNKANEFVYGPEYRALVGWENSLWEKELDEALGPYTEEFVRRLLIEPSGYEVNQGTVVPGPLSRSGFRAMPAPAPAGASWETALVDLSDGWVRVMLLPAGGGGASIGGPARLELDGTFATTLETGELVVGVFVQSGGKLVLNLKLNGQAFGQSAEKVLEASQFAGIGGELAGEDGLLLTMVLANGTAGVSVQGADAFGEPWASSAVGTVDSSGNLTASSSDGFLVSCKVGTGGGIEEGSAVIVPPDGVVTGPAIAVTGNGLNIANGETTPAISSGTDFGEVDYSSGSTTHTFRVRNSGGTTLTLGNPVSSDGQFTVVGLVSSIAAGSHDDFTVTFEPSSAGLKTATISFTTNDSDENPFEFAVSGLGIEHPGEFQWQEIASGTQVEIIGHTDPTGSLQIPDFIDGLPVTRVGDSAFKDCANLVSVSFPETVEWIGSRAFYNCASLEVVEFREGIVSIGSYAFYGCQSVVEIRIPSSARQIADNCFLGCSGLRRIHFEGSATTIYSNWESWFPGRDGFEAFGSLDASCQITCYPGAQGFIGWSDALGVKVDVIGGNLSYRLQSDDTYKVSAPSTGRESLLSVVVPPKAGGKPVTRVDDFYSCENLIDISLPGTLTHLDPWAFARCRKLEKVALPEGISGVGDYAFKECEALSEVTFGNRETTLGEGVFDGCAELSELQLPIRLQEIGAFLFRNCNSLATIVVPDDVEAIRDGAFTGCSSLAAIEIPGSVSVVEQAAFNGCSVLDNVVLPDGLEEVADEVFRGCAALSRISIPAGVSSVGQRAFRDCSALEGVSIPASVTTIGTDAFKGCASVRTVTMGNGGSPVTFEEFADSPNVESVTLNEGVIAVGAGAFKERMNLHTVNLPDSLEEILGSAFMKSGIHTIRLGEKVKSISNFAFYGCGNLESVSFPEGLEVLGAASFSSCGALRTVEFQGGPETLRHDVFSSCGKIEKVVFGEGLRTIEKHAFRYCVSLKRVEMPESMESIGANAFAECSSLETVFFFGNAPSMSPGGLGYDYPGPLVVFDPKRSGFTTPEWQGYRTRPAVIEFVYSQSSGKIVITGHTYPVGRIVVPAQLNGKPVGRIAASAFEGSSSLRFVVIPKSVTWIGKNAFRDCESLVSAEFLGDAPSSYQGIFSGCAAGFRVLYSDEKSGFTWPLWMGAPTLATGAEIALFQPKSTNLRDNKGKTSFGKVRVKKIGRKIRFTLRNLGDQKLKKLSLKVTGSARKDFKVSKLKRESVGVGGSVDFLVTFKPRKTGRRKAKLLVWSNDSNERPFDVKLLGIGK